MPQPIHKTQGGRDFDAFLDRHTRFLYETKVYRIVRRGTLLILPSGVRYFLLARIDDVWGYGEEVCKILALFAFMMSICRFKRRKWRRLLNQFSEIDIDDFMNELIPRFYGWYLLCAGQTRNLTKKVGEGANDVKKFRSLFARSPVEAAQLYEAELRSAKPEVPTPRGTIRLHYFRTLEKGKYKFGEQVKPDASMDLYVERRTGADLTVARKAWGLESLAIITDAEPFRVIFDPANEDRLSPLAAYDLSNQFTQPIRVFEPRTSKLTNVGRNVRGTGYPALFFIFTLLQLLVGFPEKNTEYMRVLYGRGYATLYNNIGRATVRLRECVFSILLLIDWLLYWVLVGIPVYSTRAGKKLAALTYNTTIQSTKEALSAIGESVVSALNSTFSLNWQTWLIILGLFWYALAEYLGRA